jgi:FAD/FMN-containing dehydrogenase
MDGFFPSKQRYAADAAWSNAPLTTLLPMLRDQAVAATSSRSFILVALALPTAANAVPPPDMALSMFGQAYVAVYGVWSDPAQDAAERKWVRAACAAIAPHTIGHYIGETDLGVDAERAQRCFTPTAWTRLQALKERFDPDERFCSYAIQPS